MANKGRRNERTRAWHARRNSDRRPAPAARRDPLEILRQLEERNLEKRRAQVRTLPPGPAAAFYERSGVEPQAPAPARPCTILEAATGARRAA